MATYQSVLDQCKRDEALAKEVWRVILLTDVVKGPTTFDQWHEVHNMFTDDPRIQNLAVGRMADFAKTFEEWKLISSFSSREPALASEALEKMAGLAKTVEEWRCVYIFAPPKSPFNKKAIEAIARLVK